VCAAIDAAPEPVVLVGHSMGGVVITQAAEWRADRLRALVYVCAYLPRNGQSLLDLARTDEGSQIVANLVIDEARGVHYLRDEVIESVFFHDASPAEAAWAHGRLIRDEPMAVVAAPVETSEARWGSLRRVYIHCTRDRALTPPLQRRMVEAQPCREQLSLDTGHSPFLAAPEALARHIAAI
jgi:pimeloyl-ACP methyl ester carboxylesterase